MKLIGFILSAIVTALGFSYLYTRGVSPVWAAVAIVCFPRFLQVYIQDCLHRNGWTDYLCYSKFLGVLNIEIHYYTLQYSLQSGRLKF